MAAFTNYNDAKTMDFLAVAIMLLFTAFLFVSYAIPALKMHTTFPMSIVNLQ